MNFSRYNDAWEKRLQKRLEAPTVYSEIYSVVPLTPIEKFRYKIRRVLSYLTRYQILDTWTIHDHCE